MKKKFDREERNNPFARAWRGVKEWFYAISVRRAAKARERAKAKGKVASVRSKKFNRRVFYCCMAALPFIHYLIFYIGVNLNSVLLAFKKWKLVDGDMVTVWAGVENFKTFFNTFFYGTELKTMLGNSLVYYLVGLIVGLPCALIFSFYIYKKYPASEFFRVILFLPSMISSVVTVFMYKYMVDYGVVELAALFGKEIMPPTAEAELRRGIVIFFNVMMSFGVNILMYASAMTRIPVSVVEYAALDGVGPFREFITITIPLIFGTISTFLIVGISGIFTNQANIQVMYGNAAESGVAPLGYHMYILTSTGAETQDKYPYLAAMGLVFTAVAVPLTFGARWLLGKIDPDVQY